jgi:uncharacterized alkaline shock family protein YloU
MIDLEKKLAFDDGDNFAEYEEIAEEEQAEDEVLEDEAEDEDEALEDDEDSVIFSEDEEDLESEDSLTFSNGVIEKIVAIAMRSVPGVVGMKGGLINRIQDAFGATDARKGVSVEVTPESAVKVNVSVFIEYGAYAPQVFEDVKKAIVKQVTGMTGLAVAGVNLRIEDVLTPEEVAARNSETEAAAPASAPALETVEEDEAAKEVVEEGSDA